MAKIDELHRTTQRVTNVVGSAVIVGTIGLAVVEPKSAAIAAFLIAGTVLLIQRYIAR